MLWEEGRKSRKEGRREEGREEKEGREKKLVLKIPLFVVVVVVCFLFAWTGRQVRF